MSSLHAAEKAVKKVFCDDYEFSIPGYQRPYSWTTEHAGLLFDDLDVAMRTSPTDPYFLGSIVLIKEERTRQAEVIDGQQRLTTLTLLLAVLAAKLEGKTRESVLKYLNEQGDEVEGLEPRPRLVLRDRDREFFHDYIQVEGKLDALVSLDRAKLNDPKKNVCNNVTFFLEKTKVLPAEMCLKLAQFIANNCYLVVVSSPNLQSAVRVFSVLNDRGMDLLPADILKAEIFGGANEREVDGLTKKWEDAEELLGRSAFSDLFAHIRMIYRRQKQQRTILEEFREHVIVKEHRDSKKLIQEVIVPFADAYEPLLNASLKSTDHAEEINSLFRWFRRIDNIDWVPPALLCLKMHGEDGRFVLQFLRDLERLAASLFIRRQSVNDRIERYARVIAELDKGADLYASDSPLQLKTSECAETVRELGGEVYEANKLVRTYVLLRLDSFLSDKESTYSSDVITVEHVLPQTVESGSEWDTLWPAPADRAAWVHRLGNLVLLTKKRNSSASNLPFAEKKQKYFTSKKGGSSFVLTSTVLNTIDWTKDTVEKRQAELLAKLITGWRLA
ncbi:DUF262 domain-containing protein [bacterium]|nr:DUF262 domain-containing protein [bacterium]